jgi:hypothetical protein
MLFRSICELLFRKEMRKCPLLKIRDPANSLVPFFRIDGKREDRIIGDLPFDETRQQFRQNPQPLKQTAVDVAYH